MMMKRVYTVTFGDVAENHVRMQKIGVLAKDCYSVEKVDALAARLTEKGLKCEVVNLSDHWSGEGVVTKAAVLVIRKGVQHIIEKENTEALMREQLLQQKTSNLENLVKEAQKTSEEGWLVIQTHTISSLTANY